VSPGRASWVLLEAAIGFCGFVAMSQLSPHSLPLELTPRVIFPASVFTLAVGMVGLGLGLYDKENRFHPRRTPSIGVTALAIAFLVTLLTIYFSYFWEVGRYIILLGAAGYSLAVGIPRAVLAAFLRSHPRRIVFLGPIGSVTDELVPHCRGETEGIPYVRNVALENQIRQLGSEEKGRIVELLRRERVSEVVLTDGSRNDPALVDLAVQSMHAGIRVVDEVAFYSELFERFPVKSLSEGWFVYSGLNTHRSFTNLLKRTFDLCVAAIALLVLSPVLLLLALAIRLSSPGPAIFTQERQGRFLRPFRIYKFRTMFLSVDGDNPPSTRVGDPRVTRLGRWIRPLHLDELPQLFNILKGEMSFVGPRPEALEFVRRIRDKVPIYEMRHLLRPGLTGHSQIRLGYSLDNEEDTWRKLSYDFYYLKNYSFALDFLILIRTVFFLTSKAR
jgi:exopolysaccharide biosynthesis polyprenyl glycosylphosphotransferase